MENYKDKYENLIEKLKKAKEEHGGYTFSSVVDNILQEFSESEDSEEEIERCWKEMFPNGWSDYTLLTLTYEEHKAFARHFAEWQKQKSMQDFWEKAEKFFKNELYVCVSNQVCSQNDFTSLLNFVEYFKNYMKNE